MIIRPARREEPEFRREFKILRALLIAMTGIKDFDSPESHAGKLAHEIMQFFDAHAAKPWVRERRYSTCFPYDA